MIEIIADNKRVELYPSDHGLPANFTGGELVEHRQRERKRPNEQCV
jgi:hypothetical protein